MKKLYICYLILLSAAVCYGESARSQAMREYLYAQRSYAANNRSEAIMYLNQAVRTDPTYAEANLMLGNIYLELHNTNQAMFSYERVENNASELNYRNDLAQMYYRMGLIWYNKVTIETNREMCRYYCEKAISVDSNFIDAYYTCAMVEEDMAYRYVYQAEAETRRPDIYLAKAYTNYMRAVQDYDRFIALATISENASYRNKIIYAYNHITEILERRESYSRAYQYLAAWKQIDPSNQTMLRRFERVRKHL